MTVGELYKGAYKAAWGPARFAKLEEWLGDILVVNYEPAVGRVWGSISAAVEAIGRAVLANDLWIAATCLVHEVPLMTFNRKDFEHVPDLRLVP